MYIIKNALKCIGRSKGRNILIGIIVLVIAVSACLGLSIRQAAESAKSEALSTMSVTAAISFDRNSMMNNLNMGAPGGFNRDDFSSAMGEAGELSLEEYLKYVEAKSVKDFYYSVTVSLNGNDDFEPVTTEADDETESNGQGNMQFGMGMGGRPNMPSGKFGNTGDFSVVGYSGENAMTEFLSGNSAVTEGDIFAEGTSEYNCIISQELALFNNLSVGDEITLYNPNSEDECYVLTVVGFYTNASANTDNSFDMFGMTATDPANKIYMSYSALSAIMEESESIATTSTDDVTGRETSTAIKGSLEGTYQFATAEDYYSFEDEVRELGLDESYTVSSVDLNSFENSLTPLKTLSTMSGTFLVVILIIGAIILVVLNIFNVRERKYEIGVLTAMGMKKAKVAGQFLAEIFIVTVLAVIIGIGVGAVSSVPVTNALLENQISEQQINADNIEMNFGRGEEPNFSQGGAKPDNMGGLQNFFGGNLEVNYINEISSAMNFTVVWQMLGIALLLTLISGSVSMLFVMRYEPLKILANRD